MQGSETPELAAVCNSNFLPIGQRRHNYQAEVLAFEEHTNIVYFHSVSSTYYTLLYLRPTMLENSYALKSIQYP